MYTLKPPNKKNPSDKKLDIIEINMMICILIAITFSVLAHPFTNTNRTLYLILKIPTYISGIIAIYLGFLLIKYCINLMKENRLEKEN